MTSNISLERAPTFDEAPADRAFRRERLCRLDGLLLAVEHANAHWRPVPETVIEGLGWFGVRLLPPVDGHDLVELIFRLQGAYLRTPRTALQIVEDSKEEAFEAAARRRYDEVRAQRVG